MTWLPSFTWSLPREPVPDHSSHPSPSSFFLIALTTICSLTHLCCGKLISVRSGLDLCCSSLYLPHWRCLTFIFVRWLSRLSLLCDSVTYGLQHTRLLRPPLSPEICSDSCPLSQWCYLTISSSATRFSFCLQSYAASKSFSMSQLLASGGQSIRVSASASVLPLMKGEVIIKNKSPANSLVIEWLRLCAFSAKGPGPIPVQGDKIPQALRCGQKKVFCQSWKSVNVSCSDVSDSLWPHGL